MIHTFAPKKEKVTLNWFNRVRILLLGKYINQSCYGANIEPWSLQNTETIPTLRLPSVKTFLDTEGLPRLRKMNTRAIFYFDQEMCPTYSVTNAAEDTETLVKKAILSFEYEIGCLPDKIILCPFRYFRVHSPSYEWGRGIKIPYRIDSCYENSYDIIVRKDPPKVLAPCPHPAL